MTNQYDPRRTNASLHALFRSPKIQTLFAIIPSYEAKNPGEWHDEQKQEWLRAISSATAPGLAVFVFNAGAITPAEFSWPAVVQRAKIFLSALTELIINESLSACPIIFCSHSAGGLILKEALRRAYEDPFNFRQLLQTLAGTILLGTPHSKSEDTDSWPNSALLLQTGVISNKKKDLDDQVDIERFATFSLDFEKANVSTPILSVYETKPTKVKTSLMSTKKMLLTDQGFVTTNASNEELLPLETKHKRLCNIDTSSTAFTTLKNFLATALEDTRLRIVRGSPEYKAATALDDWTFDEGNEYAIPQSEDTGVSASRMASSPPSDPLTKVATAGTSDAGFEIIRQVTAFPSARQGTRLPCHIVPVSRNKGFFGRSEVLKDIAQSFFARRPSVDDPIDEGPKEVRTFAICGPGGMGKTQIATEFVFTHKDRYDAIFWIFADAAPKISESFSRIALELGLVTADSVDARDPVVMRELVKGWLANPLKTGDPLDDGTIEHASWLLVFDNADYPGELEDYWPLDGPGSVLFTSRDPLAKHSNFLATRGTDLQPFAIDEGEKFLAKLTRKEEDGAGVVKVLGGFPLALTQMAGVIIRRDLTFDEFVQSYNEEESREELLQLNISHNRQCSGYEHTVASVWALESLKHGRALLEILSFLDPDGIQETILTTTPGAVSLEGFPRTSTSYQRARTELLQSSLIGRSGDRLQVHRLIQDAARTKIKQSNTQSTFSSTVSLLVSVWPFEALDWRHGVARWRLCEQLFPHVLTMQHHHSRLRLSCDTLAADLQFAKLLTDAGWYIHECGRSADSSPFFAEAQTIAETLKSSLVGGHDDTRDMIGQIDSLLAEVHHNFGCVGTETNDPKGTLVHFKIFNELMMREIGDGAQGKDKRLAISWNELGNAYMLNGLWGQGEVCFKRSISTMQRVEDFAWTDMSFPFVNLGLAYWLTDRHDMAMETLQKGLGYREAVYGVDDKDSFITGRFLHALGNVAAAQGQRDESFQYHKRALSQYLSTIGKNHHRTGDIHVKLAEHHYSFQEHGEALHNLDLALGIFGPRPNLKPELARALYKRSLVLKSMNNLADAASDHDRSMALYHGILERSIEVARTPVEDDFDQIVAFWSR